MAQRPSDLAFARARQAPRLGAQGVASGVHVLALRQVPGSTRGVALSLVSALLFHRLVRHASPTDDPSLGVSNERA